MLFGLVFLLSIWFGLVCGNYELSPESDFRKSYKYERLDVSALKTDPGFADPVQLNNLEQDVNTKSYLGQSVYVSLTTIAGIFPLFLCRKRMCSASTTTR